MEKTTPHSELASRIEALEEELATLRFEKETLERVTQSVGTGIARISKDYRTIWANKLLVDLFGDVIGKPCYSTYNGKVTICEGCGVRDVFEKGMTVSVHEQKGVDADGQEIWSQIVATPLYDKNGAVESALEVVIPITERKRAELAAQRERRFSDALIHSLPGVMYLVGPEANLLRWNRNMEVVCGYSSDEMADLPAMGCIAPGDRDFLKAQFETILEKGEGTMEAHVLTRDGREIPYYLSGVALQLEGQAYVVGTGMDLTRSLADAQQKEELISQLRESLTKVRTLSGMLPICSSCKKVRDDKGYWNQIESYIRDRCEAEFSHAICPECIGKLYPAEAGALGRYCVSDKREGGE